MPGVFPDNTDPIHTDRNGNLAFEDFEVDTAKRRLLRRGEILALSPKAFDLLVYLVANSGRVVTKDELMNAVWPDQYVEEANLKVQMSSLRKVLGESKDERRYFVTVPGTGYKFVADVHNNEDEIVIENRSFSRLIVEEECETQSEGHAELNSGNRDADYLRFLPTSVWARIAIATFALLASIGGIFWLSVRSDNSQEVSTPVLAEKATQIKRLTNKGTTDYAVLSPDGKFFAYSLRDKSSFRTSLRIGQTRGTSDAELLPAADLVYNPRSFSADGNWLYYTASEPRRFDNGTLYKIQVLGDVPQKLLSNVSVYVTLSPDEKQVAFIRSGEKDAGHALVVANLDGSGEKEIVVRPPAQAFNKYSLAWSSDGAHLAFGATTGKEKTQEIFSANVADGSLRQITDLRWIEISRLGWFRDGDGLAAVARGANNSFSTNQLWRVDYASGSAQPIINDLQHYGSSLSLSSDSKSLVAVQAVRESSIWTADAKDLSNATQLTFGSAGHEGWFGIDWTPDGKIVYVTRIDQSLTIWLMDADGGNARQITSTGFLDQRPSPTTDGKYIVFQSNRSGASEIWRMNSDGSDLQQLTTDGGNSYPHPTGDGRTVVFTHTANGANYATRVSIEGGESARIIDMECFNARVSPDGNSIACGTRIDGKNALSIVPIGGGESMRSFVVPQTFNFEGSIRWSRDGRFVIYRDWANGIWQQGLGGGPPQRLTGLPEEKLYQFDWSFDGKQAAFTRGRDVRDVVLISDFR